MPQDVLGRVKLPAWQVFTYMHHVTEDGDADDDGDDDDCFRMKNDDDCLLTLCIFI